MKQNDFASRYERKLKLCGVDVQTVRRIGKADRYEEVALVPDDGGREGRVVVVRDAKGEVRRTFVELTTVKFVDELVAAGLEGAALKARLVLERAR